MFAAEPDRAVKLMADRGDAAGQRRRFGLRRCDRDIGVRGTVAHRDRGSVCGHLHRRDISGQARQHLLDGLKFDQGSSELHPLRDVTSREQ
jgi:hypothetical protein